jgi:ubiquinone biosynthesis protein
MAMRPDYFSEEMCNELYKLFDKARPDKYERVLKILKERLGANFQMFSSIDRSPLGSASFAQVHRAVLKNGQTVAVKVQRPHVRNKVRVDLF